MTIDLPMLLRTLVYSLAVIRITHLFWYEDGPWDMFEYIRTAVGIEMSVSVEGEGMSYSVSTLRVGHTFLGKLLNCPLCLSVWFSAIAVVALYINYWWLDLVAIWLAISCISLLYFRNKTL